MARTTATDAEKEFGGRLGRSLTTARKRAGLSPRQLAARAGVSAEAIYALERARVLSPGFYTVWTISNELGLSLDELAERASQASDG